MKVYIKSKNNNNVRQLIPHNINFANAMYGFLEFGIEIILFTKWDEIKDVITKDDILVDYIDSVVKFIEMFSIYTGIENYPEELNNFFSRKIWKDSVNKFASDPNKFTKGYFIKPVKEKVFEGRIVKSLQDLIGCGSEYEDYEIFVSEPIDIVKEWRIFILYDELVGIKPYRGEMSSNSIVIEDFSKSVVKEFSKIQNRPNACCIDVGITKEDVPVVVETNDCIALGSYGLDSVYYAKMISARQSQLLDRNDTLDFRTGVID